MRIFRRKLDAKPLAEAPKISPEFQARADAYRRVAAQQEGGEYIEAVTLYGADDTLLLELAADGTVRGASEFLSPEGKKLVENLRDIVRQIQENAVKAAEDR